MTQATDLDRTRTPGEEGYLTFALVAEPKLFISVGEATHQHIEEHRPEMQAEDAFHRKWWTDHLEHFHGWSDDDIAAFFAEHEIAWRLRDDDSLVAVGRKPLEQVGWGFDRHDLDHGYRDDEAKDSFVVVEPSQMPRPHTHDSRAALRWIVQHSEIPEALKEHVVAITDHLTATEQG